MRLLFVLVLTMLAGCSEPEAETAPARQLACAATPATFCSPDRCPRDKTDVCRFLLANGASTYGGPVLCDNLGSGYDLDLDGGVRRFLFDEAGVATVIEYAPDAGARCLAGPAKLPPSTCINGLVAYRCVSDAGGVASAPADAGAD